MGPSDKIRIITPGKSQATMATRDQFLLHWEKSYVIDFLLHHHTTLTAAAVSRWIIGIGFSQLPSTLYV